MKKRKGHHKKHHMYGGRTWDEWARENKVASTALGALSGIAGFIPGVDIIAPGIAAGSYAAKLAGYGPMMRGGAVYTKGQVPLHKMSGLGLRGMVGGSSVYNNVGSAYGRIRV